MQSNVREKQRHKVRDSLCHFLAGQIMKPEKNVEKSTRKKLNAINEVHILRIVS